MSNTRRTQGVTQTIKQEIRSCKQRILVGTKVSRKGLRLLTENPGNPTIISMVAEFYTRNVYRINPLSKVIKKIKHKRIHASLK